VSHDDESRLTGRLTAHGHGRELPEVDIVARDDDELQESDDWTDFTPTGDKGADGFVSTDRDEIFFPDDGFASLDDLQEVDILATVKPIEIPDDDEDEPPTDDGPADTGASPEGEIAHDGEPDDGESRPKGVNAVLERLQAADEAAAMGASVPLRASKKRLGEILVDMSLATEEQIQQCLVRQKDTHQRLGQLLLEDKVVTALDLTKALATKFGIEYLDLTNFQLDMSAAGLLSERLCRRYGAIPVRFIDDTTLQVAMVDPANVLVADDLRIMTGYTIVPAIASEEDILGAIGKLNRLDDQVTESSDAQVGLGDDEITDIREMTEEPPIVKLVNSVIAQSVDDAASDIHFEPQAKELMIRFRLDGVLHEIMSVPRRMQNGVISRLKVMADLDIAERRVPQDGRIGLVVGGKPIDMRVATLPTVYGEKIVMRLLDKSNVMLNLTDLGFAPKALKRFQRSFTRPYGAILVTGPTGSGKSTTLYATLNIINSPEKNVITVEDPVEYRLSGINQVQVNTKAGMTFPAALRSILRCDPDIVMVGEIRDRETANIAIESALTGHLVLSTLHTNDAPGALSRLTEMGIEPFLTSSAVDCVLAQRLARRLCKECKEPYEPSEEMLKKNDFPPEVFDMDKVTLYRPKGCSRCNNTGYKGRLGIYEVMIVSEAIRRLTVERKSADEISRVAQAEGMRNLREDGIDKVLQGLTSIEEIARVII
jgi:type IV pilus assembly protein PilB